MKEVVVLDYGAGNLRSLVNSLRKVGCEPRLVERPEDIGEPDGLILPGVGAFGDCLAEIERRGFFEPVRRWFLAGKPFFGICVGYQALFEGSEESPKQRGLGLLPGRVARFPSGDWKVPHMGWNEVELVDARADLWRGLDGGQDGGQDGLDEGGRYFYFVHSYYPQLVDGDRALAWAEYAGCRFATAAGSADGRQLGTQFHPEKSQGNGLGLLKNWLDLL